MTRSHLVGLFILGLSTGQVAAAQADSAEAVLRRLAGGSTAPDAAPFGLAFKTSLVALKRSIPLEPPVSAGGAWSTKTVPSPHPSFDQYLLFVDDSIGLCQIAGVGKSIKTSRAGTQIRSAFSDLVEILAEKYGPPSTKVDVLEKGALWKNHEDWTMAMLQKERELSYTWSFGSKMPANLHSIELIASVTGPTEGFVSIAYKHEDVVACLDRISRRRNRVL